MLISGWCIDGACETCPKEFDTKGYDKGRWNCIHHCHWKEVPDS